MNTLLTYDWPGNVRELRTAIEHGVVMATGPKITIRDFPASMRHAVVAQLPGGITPARSFRGKNEPARSARNRESLDHAGARGHKWQHHVGREKAGDQPANIASKDQRNEPREMRRRKAGLRQTFRDDFIKMNLHFQICAAFHFLPCPAPLTSSRELVHAVEAGGAAVWVRRGLAVLVIAGLALYYFIHEFQGLATSQAMDQAQIGRQIASGHGWRTNVIRPRAIGQLQSHGKDVPQKIWYDTFNAPLPPLINAIALLPVKSDWKMTPRDVNYVGDKAIIFVSMLFFIGSVVMLFFIGRRLFDQRLALLSCALILICDMMWQYSLSGLPQMLLLFFFCLTTYFLLRAVQAQYGGGAVGVWLALAGVGFGLLALSHALTIWIFVGALLYSVFFFKPRGWAAFIMLVPFVVLYTPWLLRNYLICGQPGGVAIYTVFDGLKYSDIGWMRQLDMDLVGIGPGFLRVKISNELLKQFGRLPEYLGWSMVAPLFFVSLLHRFKRPETAAMRWLIFSMWLGAVLGMCIYRHP